MTGFNLVAFILLLSTLSVFAEFDLFGNHYGNELKHVEYSSFDGWYHNRAHPDWGGADMTLTRRLPSHYSDGVYEPAGKDRPNPLTISDATMDGITGNGSYLHRTAMMIFFGQQVVEEILDAQRGNCPPEYFNIPIPKGHPIFDPDSEGGKEMPFLRSRYNQNTGYSPGYPREQLNEITPWIDGGLMYGTSKAWTDALRSFVDGKMAMTSDGKYPARNDIGLPMANPPPPVNHYLKDAKRFYKLGNPRGNENPFLLTFGILWVRWHNYIAEQLIVNHSPLFEDDDEILFNEARNWVIASHQSLVFYHWLPAFLNMKLEEESTPEECANSVRGCIPKYTGYSPAIHPAISHVFQSAAMRWGHTMVTPGVFRRNATCHFRQTTKESSQNPSLDRVGKHGVRTCNAFWNPQEPIEESGGIEEFLMGMASQIAEREDNIITEDLRGRVFGPLEFSRRDLMALNIQRGRDHGLPDYNTARINFGLARIDNFLDINPIVANSSTDGSSVYNGIEYSAEEVERTRGVLLELDKVYEGNIDNVDIWPGGLLETTADGPGELFKAVILDQFLRIRDGDRFWFENELNGLFKEDDIIRLKDLTLYDVIVSATDVPSDAIQPDVFHADPNDTSVPCLQPYQLSEVDMDDCTDPETYDYFSGSEASYAVTFLCIGLFVLSMFGLVVFLSKLHEQNVSNQRKQHRKKTMKEGKKDHQKTYPADEWRGSEASRGIQVKLGPGKAITVLSERGRIERLIDLSRCNTIDVYVAADKRCKVLLIRIEKEYDLVLKFDSNDMRTTFISDLESFLGDPKIGIGRQRYEAQQSKILKMAQTKAYRQSLLESFFKAAFAQAFNIPYDKSNLSSMTSEKTNEVLNCELTKTEFAEALSLKPNSVFIEKMFELIDKDKNGYLSFREFLDMLVIFAKGSPEDKLHLFFDMYDISGDGKLSRSEFQQMIKSFMDLVSSDLLDAKTLDELVHSMFKNAGMEHKQELTFADFDKLMEEHKKELQMSALNLKGAGVDIPELTMGDRADVSRGAKTVIKRENAPSRAQKTIFRAYKKPPVLDAKQKRLSHSVKVETKVKDNSQEKSTLKFNIFKRYIENRVPQIFWLSLYMLVLAGVFMERSYYYSIEREHAGLRRIAGFGISTTRGAASAMMFTYATLLVTMSRNTITYLRETFLHRYVPFDSAHDFHKIVAYTALFFTAGHCIGHGFNFYHIATQPANDLGCLFREYWHRSDVLPKFHYWCWETITGLTGVFLLLVVVVMYIFALPYARRQVFNAFWWTHQLYVLLYLLMILHGSGRLVQDPISQWFFIGPAIIYTLDKLVSISRKKVEISVMKAELLPSDVTHLEFKRPTSFEYKSGQWVRIACINLGGSEYHPFTLTSSPHEDNLSLHIRAVGPWTMNLRHTYDPHVVRDHSYPKLYLDGPFGEGHQDWYRFEVAVLVGGGIGVTPFASILKDIVQKSKMGAAISCKKVYFIWVTRTQKQYEWLTDIIREVEDADTNNLVSVHIFITQFFQRFDLRTSMLYICERHFQKISNRSLFTGLQSITHFGRPQFKSFLDSLQQEHPTVSKIGVFSCGPPTMTSGVNNACAELNQIDGAAFIHHFENF